MAEPRISILMPFRNTAAFLEECLTSIRSQSYKNWEVVAVNDHSEDASKTLMKKAALADSRIRVLDNAGTGIIPALRQAYAASSGELITRMDSDDRMSPDRLETMAGELIRNGQGHLALGLVKYFSDAGVSDGYARYEKWLNGLSASGDNFSEIYKECVIPSPCWMVWRQDLDQSGAFLPDLYPEDYDLCFRFYRTGLRCLPATKVLHYWRDYAWRTSRTCEHYAQNYFLEIKTRYFLELDRQPSRPLVIWGAGYKGKKVARLLLEAGEPFRWVCDNPRKIGKKIYGVRLEHYRAIFGLTQPQSIITVANETAQVEIEGVLGQLQLEQPKADYFFFC